WSRLHDQIISHSVDRKTGKTFNELRNEAYHEDRNVRKYAYEKELEILQTYDIPLAAALNNIKGATIRLNQKRRWEGAIEKSLYYNRISNKTLNALIGAMEDSLPFWRSYFDVKAKLLGVEKCAFYDMFAPLMPKNSAKVSEKIWDFAEAKKYITERFYAFSKDMGDFAEQAFSGGWIDAKIRKGKVGGAYCEYFPAQKESRILSNFSGTFSDITTLAHELGHAYHNHCVKNADIPFTHYPMTLAETASIFCETIVIKKAISETTGFERIKLLEMHLSDANQVTVDILSRFYFERAVFEERSSQELGVQDFCRLMAKAQEKTYGSGLSEERHSYMWAVKSHYYSPELDFYNFPYAFGLLFSLSLYARYKNEGTSFVPMYENLLRETGRADCETICRNLGFDIESKDFWASGLDVFKEELCELQAYANENA
ncbi:MAG: M3 family metallopeptidase, partial [Spirochaetales bacterium]